MFGTPGTHYSSTRPGPFRQLVLQVLASTRVISAVDTQGTREYSSYTASVFKVPARTFCYQQSFSMYSRVLGQRVLSHISSRSQCTREYLAISAVGNQGICEYSVISTVGSPGTHEYPLFLGYSPGHSHISSRYSRYSRVLSRFSRWYSRYSPQ